MALNHSSGRTEQSKQSTPLERAREVVVGASKPHLALEGRQVIIIAWVSYVPGTVLGAVHLVTHIILPL